MAHLGEGAAADAVVAFVRTQHGVVLNSRKVPVLRASVKEKALLERFRQPSAALAAEFQAATAKPGAARKEAATAAA